VHSHDDNGLFRRALCEAAAVCRCVRVCLLPHKSVVRGSRGRIAHRPPSQPRRCARDRPRAAGRLHQRTHLGCPLAGSWRAPAVYFKFTGPPLPIWDVLDVLGRGAARRSPTPVSPARASSAALHIITRRRRRDPAPSTLTEPLLHRSLPECGLVDERIVRNGQPVQSAARWLPRYVLASNYAIRYAGAHLHWCTLSPTSYRPCYCDSAAVLHCCPCRPPCLRVRKNKRSLTPRARLPVYPTRQLSLSLQPEKPPGSPRLSPGPVARAAA
jgi:hypothetical protein